MFLSENGGLVKRVASLLLIDWEYSVSHYLTDAFIILRDSIEGTIFEANEFPLAIKNVLKSHKMFNPLNSPRFSFVVELKRNLM